MKRSRHIISGQRADRARRSRAAKLGWKHRRERERKEFERRSRSAKLGWKHRRERERKEFERRSRASRKGWRKRKKARKMVDLDIALPEPKTVKGSPKGRHRLRK